ncbi:MAG: DMT family transporter [Desulfobacterales bacterium]|nr:DMT family transporter [Desulfobacterales bacterium]
MKSTFMYLFCSLTWGLNFLIIKIQGNIVPLEISLFYRLSIACIIFFLVAAIGKKPLLFRKNQKVLFLFGAFNFCTSYLLLYYATFYVSSMFVCVIFSFKTIITPLLIFLFLKGKLDGKVMFGGLISILGIIILLYPKLYTVFDSNFLLGCIIALSGTIATSLGDVCSAKNCRDSIEPVPANAYGFLYASLILFGYIRLSGIPFSFDTSPSYIFSIAYLCLFASVFAWLFYLNLIQTIGVEKSSYMVASFPVIATIASLLTGEVRPDLNIVAGSFICTAGAFVALNVISLIRQPHPLSRQKE